MVPKRDFLTVSDLSRDELTLRDLLQPCRVLADLLTLHEALGGWEGKIVARVGDGNIVANAWSEAAGVLGFERGLPGGVRARPGAVREEPEAHPAQDHRRAGGRGGRRRPGDHRCLDLDQGYTVTQRLMDLASPEAVFLHCLPAHRGEEVEEAVLEGPRSRVWEEAENRLHVQKVLLLKLVSLTSRTR